MRCSSDDAQAESGGYPELIGEPVEVGLFPPFYTDCGKNIHLGKGVFINAGCKFQDQGGIYIGDGALIGHNTVLATLNHGLLPEERHDLIPRPIHIGRNVWIGSNSTILSGVTHRCRLSRYKGYSRKYDSGRHSCKGGEEHL